MIRLLVGWVVAWGANVGLQRDEEQDWVPAVIGRDRRCRREGNEELNRKCAEKMRKTEMKKKKKRRRRRKRRMMVGWEDQMNNEMFSKKAVKDKSSR